jgi:hypothetical protein
MQRTIAFALLVGLVVLAVARPAAAQDRVREAREMPAFTKVALSVPGTLHLRQGDARSVEVVATREVLDHLVTVVEDGRLKIRDESNVLERMFDGGEWEEVDVYVTASTVEAVALAGSGTVVGETPIEGPTLSLENAGSGEMDLEVTTSTLRASIAGSGAIRVRGTADEVSVRVAGSGTVDGLDLRAATADVQVAGSGDTRLHVTDRLSAQIMGSGDVAYRGAPSIEESILGSGAVRPADE